MTAPTFEWDPDKAAANLKAHKVSFEEALTAFRDPLAVVHADAQYGVEIRQMLVSTRAPDGPVRFHMEASLRELAQHQATYGLQENASHLADRSILLVGGWDDSQVTVEDVLLPLYRSVKAAGAQDVTFLAYQDNHAFWQVREELAAGIQRWLTRQLSR